MARHKNAAESYASATALAHEFTKNTRHENENLSEIDGQNFIHKKIHSTSSESPSKIDQLRSKSMLGRGSRRILAPKRVLGGVWGGL